MAHLTQQEIDEIIDFICSHYVYDIKDYKIIEDFILKHIQYNTLLVVRDRETNAIVALCRWNILPTGHDAHIMDIAVRADHRNQQLMKRMLLQGLRLYPEVKYLIFERHDKNKPFKKVPVKWLLKRRF